MPRPRCSTSPAGSTACSAGGRGPGRDRRRAPARRATGSRSPAASPAASGAAGVTVVSGMALGIDSAAHTGAITAGGATVAVLPAGAERAYPPAKRALHAQIPRPAPAISELPPGSDGVALDVPGAQPADRRAVGDDGRRRGAGAIGRARHRQVRRGARPSGRGGARAGHLAAVERAERAARARGDVVRGAQDVLDQLFGAGSQIVARRRRGRGSTASSRRCSRRSRTGTTPRGRSSGRASPAEQGLAALASLELARVRPARAGREVRRDHLRPSKPRLLSVRDQREFPSPSVFDGERILCCCEQDGHSFLSMWAASGGFGS